MALLPTGYTQCRYVMGVFDAGVYPSNRLTIDALLGKSPLDQNGFLFGARNTNSNTSQGQMNLNIATNAVYFGYSNARVTLSSNLIPEDLMHIHVDANVMTVVSQKYATSGTGVTTAFTGTRTMYIGALNNAGAILGDGLGAVCFGFIIWEDGTKVKDFVPCYEDASGEYGLYDLVDGVFVHNIGTAPLVTLYSASVGTAQGGAGFIMTEYGNRLISDIGGGFATAVPEQGYVFKEWQDSDGNVLSDRETFNITPTADITIIPVFEKIADFSLGLNYKMIVLGRHFGDAWSELTVTSAEITDDILQKSTSTITVEELPDSIGEGQGFALFSPRFKQVYAGVIESTEGKTLTCREVLAFYDKEYLFTPGMFSYTDLNVLYASFWLIYYAMFSRSFGVINDDAEVGDIINQLMTDPAEIRDWRYNLMVHDEENISVPYPAITETGAQNLEDVLLGLGAYGIGFSTWMDYHYDVLRIRPTYRSGQPLTLSDNYEGVSDAVLVSDLQEDNLLIIYNEAGTALRAIYGVTTDGKVVNTSTVSQDDLLSYYKYKSKVVLSNDNISTIVAGNLSNAGLNHKITFNINFDGMISFEMVKTGTPVDFYLGNKLYHSVITAISYSILPNQEQIANASVTLGNVRTSLTAKLNMGKVR